MRSINIPLPQLHFGRDDAGFWIFGVSFLDQETRLATKHAVMVKIATLSEEKALRHGQILGDTFVWDEGNGNVHALPCETVRAFLKDETLDPKFRAYYTARLEGQIVPFPDLESEAEPTEPAAISTEVVAA